MYDYLQNGIKGYEEKTVLYFEGRKIKAKTLLKEIDKAACSLLAMGIKSGDVVALNMPNVINSVIVFYACNKIGCIVNIVHPLLPIAPLLEVLKENNCKALFGISLYFDKFQEELKQYDGMKIVNFISDYLPPIKKQIYSLTEPKIQKDDKTIFYNDFMKKGKGVELTGIKKLGVEDTCVYLLSGGTTGKSKTICLSARAFNNLSKDLETVIDDVSPYHNTVLMSLPMFHGFGLGVCLHTMISHAFEVVLMPRFEALKAVNLMAKRRVTMTAGVPLMYSKILKLDDKQFAKIKTLEHIFCGGDQLPAHVKHAFDARLKSIGSNSEILEGYGLTEVVSVCCLNKKNDYDFRNIGYCLDNIKMDIIDTDGNSLEPNIHGEIIINANTLMNGYLNQEDTIFEKNGEKWLRTGDIGYKDDKGKFYFVDRLKRMFVVAGVNVFPSDIESIVNDLEYVRESYASFEKEKNSIILYVVFNKGENKKERMQDVLNICENKLIKYAMPREIVPLDRLPRTSVGKIDIGLLNQSYKQYKENIKS